MMQKKKAKTAQKRTASERKRTLIRLFGNTPAALKLNSGVLSPLYWAFRRFHYWLCFYDNDVEIDVEDLLANPFNTQPPSLDDLGRLTGFRRDWIMFLYRNFKQICSNGRMSQAQWRQIFRLIFKGATDYEFADRIFMAIAGNRAHPLITFEDLIFCLFDLIQSFRCTPLSADCDKTVDDTPTPEIAVKWRYASGRRRGSPLNARCDLWDQMVTKSAECSFDDSGGEIATPFMSASMGALTAGKPRWLAGVSLPAKEPPKMENPVPSTTTSQFTFALMQPDSRGLVDEAAFLRYTKCIFDLNASVGSSADMASFGMVQHMGSTSNGGGGSGGIEGSVSYSQSSSSHSNEHSRSSKREKSNQSTFMPWQEAIAKQQFKALDADGDGFVTLADIQRIFDQRNVYESLILHLESEIMQQQNDDVPNAPALNRSTRRHYANNQFANNKNGIAINVN